MEQVANIYGNTAPTAPQHHTTTEMVISRQAQEVQAAMVIAKRFPRDEVQSFSGTGSIRVSPWRDKGNWSVHSPGRGYGSELG